MDYTLSYEVDRYFVISKNGQAATFYSLNDALIIPHKIAIIYCKMVSKSEPSSYGNYYYKYEFDILNSNGENFILNYENCSLINITGKNDTVSNRLNEGPFIEANIMDQNGEMHARKFYNKGLKWPNFSSMFDVMKKN